MVHERYASNAGENQVFADLAAKTPHTDDQYLGAHHSGEQAVGDEV
jgi:hypothetical protein